VLFNSFSLVNSSFNAGFCQYHLSLKARPHISLYSLSFNEGSRDFISFISHFTLANSSFDVSIPLSGQSVFHNHFKAEKSL
jgi:hypothetical protein